MKKTSTLMLLAALLLTAQIGQSQMPKWVVGSSLLDMTGSSPSSSATLTSASSQRVSNGAYDLSGNLLFYVRDGYVYNPGNTNVGYIGPASYIAREMAIVPVPGVCNKFYVIMLSATSTCITCGNLPHLFYAVVQVNNGVVSVTSSNQNLGYVGNAGLAVSKLRPDKTRFLFTVGDGVKRFVISGTGISSATTLSTYGSSTEQPKEVELYENPSNGSMNLAYTMYGMLTVQPLTNQGALNGSSFTATTGGLDEVYGLEFVSQTRIAFGARYHTGSQTLYGLGVYSFSGTPSVSYISNSSDYYQSQIEAAGGNLYTSKPYIVSGSTLGYKLGVIDATTMSVTEVSGLVLPSMDNAGLRLLPDQVDNEDYVAMNYKVDLLARDGSDDIGAEPNPNFFWKSPDIWNLRNNSGDPNENQDPGFQANNGLGNLMKMRVQNIGCRASAPSKVRMYWAMGSTGEHWPNSWNGVDMINGAPGGGELTLSSSYGTYNNGYDVPLLQPGQSAIIMAKWFPPSPADFGLGLNSKPMLCFLGRIDDPAQDPMFSELNSNSVSVGHNVQYNNNIVTRNTVLLNLPGYFRLSPPRGGTIFVHNYAEMALPFNIRFYSLADVDADFGNLGHVVLQLDPRLWDRWVRGGRMAEGLEVSDPENRQVRVTDLHRAVLRNIVMDPDEAMSIQPIFQLDDITDVRQDFSFAVAQDKVEYEEGEEPYGSECVFLVTVNGVEETGDGSGEIQRATSSEAPATDKTTELSIAPNPVVNSLTVRYIGTEGATRFRILGMNGQVVRTIQAGSGAGLQQQVINVSDLKSGHYVLELVSPAGTRSIRFVVLH